MDPAAILIWLKRTIVGHFGALNFRTHYNQDLINNTEHNDDLLRKII